MTVSRIYQNQSLAIDSDITLTEAASHHLSKVLRAKLGDQVVVFNGTLTEFIGTITAINKKFIKLHLHNKRMIDSESPLATCLALGISRGDKMDYTIQKAVELGVRRIVPLMTARCTVKLSDERLEKRWQHWQGVVISACEQSNRVVIPALDRPQTLTDWLKLESIQPGFVLDPTAKQGLNTALKSGVAGVTLLVGPEGGLSETEINQAVARNFLAVRFGPRILRTETAAVTSLAVIQYSCGDLGN